MPVTPAVFTLPVWFDLGAVFAIALTGALAGIGRGYDIVGVFFLALVSSIGGGLLRDGVLLPGSEPTPLLTDARYIGCVAVATVAGVLFGSHLKRAGRVIAYIDAIGLGAYATFGTQKALQAGLAVPAAILVGVVNAAGGSLLRDVIVREEPLVFRPGQFYVLTALAGAASFVVFSRQMGVGITPAAVLAIALTFVFRALAIVFNWRTTAVAPASALPPPPSLPPPL
ncbi:MAG: TRIC cation channel family protein [Opitutaceae bacterium]|nr:TRIC cation channel family protein [Opitutaceae bacterium]